MYRETVFVCGEGGTLQVTRDQDMCGNCRLRKWCEGSGSEGSVDLQTHLFSGTNCVALDKMSQRSHVREEGCARMA